MKFLVVDDSVMTRRVIVSSLERIGYDQTVEANDGQEALDKLDASVGFVIADWEMSGMSGIEFVRALRSREEGRAVPILMVTARSARDNILEAIEAGVNNFLLAPFTPPVLKEKIDQVLKAGGVS